MNIIEEANFVLKSLLTDQSLNRFIDPTLNIPNIHKGEGEIKLIILGQDPTVKNPKSRESIKTVLNLDKRGSLTSYLKNICSQLQLDINQNVYATNFFKNFFIEPPTQIKEIDVFIEFSPYWLELLQKELSLYPDVPIISLGQPLLQAVIKVGFDRKVRNYWGYTNDWKVQMNANFTHSCPDENHLNRHVFPFPHQPSINKVFYKDRLNLYLEYVKQFI